MGKRGHLSEPAEMDIEVNRQRARLVAGQGVQVAGACKDGQAVLRRTRLVRWR